MKLSQSGRPQPATNVDSYGPAVIFDDMEVRLTPEQQAHLAELAARDGRNVDEIAQEAIARYLDNETRFAEAVRLGIAAADRGEFIASEEGWAGVERILQS